MIKHLIDILDEKRFDKLLLQIKETLEKEKGKGNTGDRSDIQIMEQGFMR